MLLVAGLAACREQEQARPLAYEKGVYGGQQDEPLTEEAQERLRQRQRQLGQGW